MKPSFTTLMQHYPASELREVLYKQIGWSDVIDHPGFKDTCAIRMSIALAYAGVPIRGMGMTIRAGELKGRAIEARQSKLSQELKRLWGAPEVYKDEEAANAGIGSRCGVVSFFRIRLEGEPTSSGHIDLVYPDANGFQRCARSCFFDAAEVWYWPLT